MSNQNKGECIIPQAKELETGDEIDTLVYMGGRLGGTLRIFNNCVVMSVEVIMGHIGNEQCEVKFRYDSQVPVVETERTLMNLMRGPKLEYLLDMNDEISIFKK